MSLGFVVLLVERVAFEGQLIDWVLRGLFHKGLGRSPVGVLRLVDGSINEGCVVGFLVMALGLLGHHGEELEIGLGDCGCVHLVRVDDLVLLL